MNRNVIQLSHMIKALQLPAAQRISFEPDMDTTPPRTEISPQPLGPAYDYDELLLLLTFGLNSSSSFTSKTNRVQKGGSEHASQPLFESLQICQDCYPDQHSKDQVNDSSRAQVQPSYVFVASNSTGQDEDPYVSMFQDLYQISAA